MINKLRGTFAGAGAIVLVLTALAKMLSFVQNQVTAASLGTSSDADVFLLALTIPSLGAGVLGPALSTLAIPVYTSVSKRSAAEARRFVAWLISLAVLLSGVLMIIGVATAPALVAAVAPGFGAEPHGMAIIATRFVFAGLVLIVLDMLLRAVLNAYTMYSASAASALVSSVVFVVLVWFFAPSMVFQFCWIWVASMAVQVLFQVAAILWKHAGSFRLTVRADPQVAKAAWTLAWPLIVNNCLIQLFIVVDRACASVLSPGSISALTYAEKIKLVPLGLVTTVTAGIVFRIASDKVEPQFSRFISYVARWLVIVMVPVVMISVVLRTEIVSVLFERGAFDQASTTATAVSLGYFAPGLLFNALTSVLVVAFYVLGDSRTPLYTSAVGIGVNIALDLALVGKLGVAGIALAGTITNVFVACAQVWLLKRRYNLGLAWGRRFIVGQALGGAVMCVTLFRLTHWLGSQAAIIRGGVAGTVGLLVFGAVSCAVSMPGAVRWGDRVMRGFMRRE